MVSKGRGRVKEGRKVSGEEVTKLNTEVREGGRGGNGGSRRKTKRRECVQ